jgi:hypothetical protein
MSHNPMGPSRPVTDSFTFFTLPYLTLPTNCSAQWPHLRGNLQDKGYICDID